MGISSLRTHIQRHTKAYLIGLGIAVGLLSASFYLSNAPETFPISKVVTITPGDSVVQITRALKEQGVVRSPRLLNHLIILLGGEHRVVSGEYMFDTPLNVLEVARRITDGQFGFIPKRITVPEGLSNKEVAQIFDSHLAYFDTQEFLALAKDKEGRLFPDTYYFMSNSKAEDVIARMESTFNKRIASIQADISHFDRSIDDVIIMASILEEEARLTETRRVVAGILWRRIDKGMPLQVDGTFKYINGKGSEDLTLDDLKIDSPYNTYVYKGLPPNAVSNPGLDALKSAVTPIKTQYLYFLTDDDGVMHYAITLEEHVKNKNMYLR
jgi:UPF0755 protein